jgi:hypothetical protein
VTSRYDTDPDALAWARAKVQHHIERLVEFERQADTKGDIDKARGLAIARRSTEQLLIGGEGCVIGAFDARRPDFTRAVDSALPPAVDRAVRRDHSLCGVAPCSDCR